MVILGQKWYFATLVLEDNVHLMKVSIGRSVTQNLNRNSNYIVKVKTEHTLYPFPS